MHCPSFVASVSAMWMEDTSDWLGRTSSKWPAAFLRRVGRKTSTQSIVVQRGPQLQMWRQPQCLLGEPTTFETERRTRTTAVTSFTETLGRRRRCTAPTDVRFRSSHSIFYFRYKMSPRFPPPPPPLAGFRPPISVNARPGRRRRRRVRHGTGAVGLIARWHEPDDRMLINYERKLCMGRTTVGPTVAAGQVLPLQRLR